MGTTRGLVLLLSVALSPTFAGGAGLNRVWTLDLKRILPQQPAGWDNYGVWGLGFSHDGKRLAIGFGHTLTDTRIMRRLAIIGIDSPAKPIAWFDVSLGSGYLATEFTAVTWSPDDRRLAISGAAGTILLDVIDRTQCSIEAGRASFSSASQLLAATFGNAAASVITVGTDCGTIRSLPLAPGDLVEGIWGSTSVLAIHRSSSKHLEAFDASKGRILADLGADFAFSGFAENGSVLCGLRERRITCRNLATANETVSSIAGVSWVTGEFRSGGHRIAASAAKCSPYHTVLDFRGTCAATNRMVWDLDTLASVAEYAPVETSSRPPTLGRRIRLRYAYELSPDGTRLADGSPDRVTLYRIAP